MKLRRYYTGSKPLSSLKRQFTSTFGFKPYPSMSQIMFCFKTVIIDFVWICSKAEKASLFCFQTWENMLNETCSGDVTEVP
jgi:hypothetical protein